MGGQPVVQPVSYVDPSQTQQVAPMPTAPPPIADASPAASEKALQPAEPEKKGLSLQHVTNVVQNVTSNIVDADTIGLDDSLMDSGMDSLSAINFRNTLTKELNLKLPGTLMFDFPTMRGVAEHLYEVANE